MRIELYGMEIERDFGTGERRILVGQHGISWGESGSRDSSMTIGEEIATALSIIDGTFEVRRLRRFPDLMNQAGVELEP